MSSNKEHKNAYKQMKFKAGIYQLKNLKSNKKYLATSLDLERAFNSDRFQLNAGLHRNKELQYDWNMLGNTEFEFAVVDELKTEDTDTEVKIKSELNEFIEMYRIELLKKGEHLY